MNTKLYETINLGNGKRKCGVFLFKKNKEINYKVLDIYAGSPNDTENRFLTVTNELKEEGYNPVIAYSNVNAYTSDMIREYVNPNKEKRKTIMLEEEIKNLTARLLTP